MPIPSKKGTERKEAFIQRCMNDKVMAREYPDPKQRYAICSGRYKE